MLNNHFQYIFPMTVIYMFSDICNIKLWDCKEINDYTNRNQIAYYKILSLIADNSAWISKRIIELTL